MFRKNKTTKVLKKLSLTVNRRNLKLKRPHRFISSLDVIRLIFIFNQYFFFPKKKSKD